MANRLAQVIAGLILFLVVARAASGQEEISFVQSYGIAPMPAEALAEWIAAY